MPNTVRHPITLYDVKFEFGPKVNIEGDVWTSYVLEVDEIEMRKLFDFLKERLEKSYIAARIMVTGRLVSK